MESAQSYMTATVADSKVKIDSLSADLREVKALLTVIQPIAKWIAGGIWTLVAGAAAFVMTLAGMWSKHHFGW